MQAALELAAEVDDLRHLGHDSGVLAEAVSRLEQRDPKWRRAFADLYGDSLDAMRRDELVELDLDELVELDLDSLGPND